MEKQFNLETLRSFVVFSETLNFTHAAELLYISQPALHVRVQELAEFVGFPLYRRVGRKLELTEHGVKVARFGRDIQQHAQTFYNEITTGASEETIVLAAGEGAYLYLLGDGIRQFVRNREHRLKLLTMDKDHIFESIKSGRADLGVAALDARPSEFECQTLARVEQCLVMPKNHALSKKRQLTLTDLRGEKLIVPPENRPHRQVLSSLLQSAGIDWHVAVEASGWELMLHFVKLGLGLAVVNSFCTIPRQLVAKPIKDLPQIHYYVFNLKGSVRRREVSLLKENLHSGIPQFCIPSRERSR